MEMRIETSLNFPLDLFDFNHYCKVLKTVVNISNKNIL